MDTCSCCRVVQRLKTGAPHREHVQLQELAGLAEWQPPQAGMFLWLRLLQPPADEQRLVDALQDQRVVVVPGACRNLDPEPYYLNIALQEKRIVVCQAHAESGTTTHAGAQTPTPALRICACCCVLAACTPLDPDLLGHGSRLDAAQQSVPGVVAASALRQQAPGCCIGEGADRFADCHCPLACCRAHQPRARAGPQLPVPLPPRRLVLLRVWGPAEGDAAAGGGAAGLRGRRTGIRADVQKDVILEGVAGGGPRGQAVLLAGEEQCTIISLRSGSTCS